MRPDIYIYLFMYSSIFCIIYFLNMSVALVGQNNFYSDLLLSSNSSVMLILLHLHLVI